jgi:hypothetical protein
MRGGLLFILISLAWSTSAMAQTPPAPNVPQVRACERQGFEVSFDGSAELSQKAIAQLDRGLDLARPCNVWTTIVTGGDAAQVDAVIAAMIAENYPPHRIERVVFDAERFGRTPPAESGVVHVTIAFR